MPAASHISFKDYKYIPMLLIHSEVCCSAGDRPMASAVQKGGRGGGGGGEGAIMVEIIKVKVHSMRLR